VWGIFSDGKKERERRNKKGRRIIREEGNRGKGEEKRIVGSFDSDHDSVSIRDRS